MSEVLSVKEKIGYGLGDAASHIIFDNVMLYMMFFYTDIFGIPAGYVGTMFLLARALDALSDPCMGLIADRTRTRFGKFRPYVLFGAIPFFQLFELEEGHCAESRLVDQTGTVVFTLAAERHGQQITLRATGAAPGWRLCLRNVMAISDVRHGANQQGEWGAIITPERGAESIIITLP